MTGFAFYSCEDVVDNPAKDPAQSWNYSVSVKFSDFDFTGAPGTPTYQAPTTLYVFNEEMTPMGTITTDAAPALGDYGTYAGTLTGTIGNNLIIVTKTGADLAKQDGTIESAIENGIVQTAEVPIKIYNANSGTLTTATAKMENKTAVVKFWLTGSAVAKDKKVTFSTDNLDIPGLTEKSFTVTLKEDLDATTNYCYFALGTNTTDPINIKAEIDAADRGAVIASEKEDITLNYGKIDNLGSFYMQASQVDLTKYWAAYKEANENAKYVSVNGLAKGAVVTQSDSEAVPVYLSINDDATLKGINIGGENDNIGIYFNKQGTMNVTLEDKNVINSPNKWDVATIDRGQLILKGTGSLETLGQGSGLYLTSSSYIDDNSNKVYTCLNIEDGVSVTTKHSLDVNGSGIYVDNNATLIIGENVNFTAEGYYAIKLRPNSKINVEKDATVTAKGYKNGNGIESFNATWDIKDGAKIYAFGGKAGRGINMYGDGTKTIKIGKIVTIEAQGAPNINEDALGWGMSISNPGDVTIGEGTTIKAIGADRYGLYIGDVNIAIAEGATIEAIDALSNALETNGATITGKGKLLANQAGKIGIAINSGTLTLNGASIEATGGAGKAGIQVGGALAIGTDVISVKAKAGTGAKCIADGNGDEVELKDLVGVTNVDKFNETSGEGVRTITPKPAAK